ncbi:MAG: LysR family transcriptional regulator [Clostridia bacterium]|nr:LysR family transcriptional regulator [Clostridia bacterium]
MNLIQLKYFEAICKYGTVMSAAEHMHISQPSLSAAIKSLESEFGVTLFKRGHHGMTLTAEGETLYKMSLELTRRADEIESIMNDLGGESKILRLGIPPMIGSLILPRLFHDFNDNNPDVRLEITEGSRHELYGKLSEGFVDMVFLPHSRPLDKELSSLKIGRLEIVCCVSGEDPLAKKTSVRPALLANKPLVLFENSFFQTQEIKNRFAADKIEPNILLQTNQLSTLMSMISSGIAAGFMFRDLIKADAGLALIPLCEPMYIDVSLAWRRSSHQKYSMKALREYLAGSDIFIR